MHLCHVSTYCRTFTLNDNQGLFLFLFFCIELWSDCDEMSRENTSCWLVTSFLLGAHFYFILQNTTCNWPEKILQHPTWRVKRIYVYESLKFRRENVGPASRGLAECLNILQPDRSFSSRRKAADPGSPEETCREKSLQLAAKTSVKTCHLVKLEKQTPFSRLRGNSYIKWQ